MQELRNRRRNSTPHFVSAAASPCVRLVCESLQRPRCLRLILAAPYPEVHRQRFTAAIQYQNLTRFLRSRLDAPSSLPEYIHRRPSCDATSTPPPSMRALFGEISQLPCSAANPLIDRPLFARPWTWLRPQIHGMGLHTASRYVQGPFWIRMNLASMYVRRRIRCVCRHLYLV